MKKFSSKLKVVITGSEGNIGSILQRGLSDDFDLYLIDKKSSIGINHFRIDIVSDRGRLKSVLKSKDVLIHLAWDNKEDFPNEEIVPENKTMAENIYRISREVGLKKVIIASSVHADNYSNNGENLISATRSPYPDGPYGASKTYIENLGKYYSQRYGLQVICIRFGGVNLNDEVLYNEDPEYDKVLLYKEDCIDLIKKCLYVKKVPSNYAVFYAVSNNLNRIHSINNFLNWQPKFPKK